MVRVTFLHPDLGIGGAERLIVDAALALKKSAHDVNIVTTHYDPERCFVETKNGTLPVIVVGNWLPRHIFGKFYAFCAYIRMVSYLFCNNLKIFHFFAIKHLKCMKKRFKILKLKDNKLIEIILLNFRFMQLFVFFSLTSILTLSCVI